MPQHRVPSLRTRKLPAIQVPPTFGAPLLGHFISTEAAGRSYTNKSGILFGDQNRERLVLYLKDGKFAVHTCSHLG